MRAAAVAGNMPTAQQQAEYEARDRSGEGILAIAGDKAQIDISGVLTVRPSFFAMLFGGGNTTYGEITAALADAEQDPNVKEITLAIDSPGGQIDGLFDTLAALQGVNKPMKAVVHNVGASAAYAIAAQADTITAANRATRVGSVGIAATFFVSDDEISLTSRKAPLKNPDVRTAKGKAAVLDQLDALHEIFVDAIAEGRNIKVQKVNADFGRGATVLAEQALRRGMIDNVQGVENKAAAGTGGDRKTEARKMDLAIFKAENPDVYAAAVQIGVDSERDRVGAHLKMGEASGDVETASKAILDGSPMTATLQATYLSAGMNKADTAARQGDDAGAGAGDGAIAPTEGDEADQVAALVEANMGSEV
jgi:ClpP class serine protease